MKRLKPGQLCTINHHVFQCKESADKHPCDKCAEENGIPCIACIQIIPSCIGRFGLDCYPKLIK